MSAESPRKTPFQMRIPLGSPDADVDPVVGSVVASPRKFQVLAAYLVNGAAIAASDTDFAVVTLRDKDDAVVATYDTRAAGQGALAENVPKAMALASAEPAVEAGKVYAKYDETDTGTAVALTTAYIVLWGFWKQTEGVEALS